MKSIWREIKGFVLWTHNRGSLRYDIMVALILAFIFLTPRHIFRDQPPPAVEAVEEGLYRIDANALELDGAGLDERINTMLHDHLKQDVRVVRKEAVKDAGGTLLAYKVWVAR